jgi:hypothetical protein
MTNKFYEARESLPLELREKFTNEVWRHKPPDWETNPNWVEGAYLEYLKKQDGNGIIWYNDTNIPYRNIF